MSRRTAATHRDARTAKLLAHGSPGNAQLSTDLAQGPTPAVLLLIGPEMVEVALEWVIRDILSDLLPERGG